MRIHRSRATGTSGQSTPLVQRTADRRAVLQVGTTLESLAESEPGISNTRRQIAGRRGKETDTVLISQRPILTEEPISE